MVNDFQSMGNNILGIRGCIFVGVIYDYGWIDGFTRGSDSINSTVWQGTVLSGREPQEVLCVLYDTQMIMVIYTHRNIYNAY